jgi:hypothetical protein
MSTDENKFQRGEWFEGQFYPDDDSDQGEPPAPPRTAIPEPDLQLLELAARALGAVRIETIEGEQWVNLHFEDGSTVFGWNPLRHSDDTFTMMVRLHLLDEHADFTYKLAEEQGRDGVDQVVAARRAAVRAAAEIGRNQT